MAIVLEDTDLFAGFGTGISHGLTVGLGNGRMLLAVIKRMGNSANQTFVNPAYNGVPLLAGPVASALSYSNRHNVGSFWLGDADLPPGTGTYNLTWTFGGTGALYGWNAVVFVFSGVDQVNLINNSTSAFSDNNYGITSYSTNITTLTSNCLLLDYCTINDSNTAGVPGSGQTSIYDVLANGSRMCISTKTVPSPLLTNMNWTFGAGNAVSQGILEIVTAGGGPPVASDNSIFFGTHF